MTQDQFSLNAMQNEDVIFSPVGPPRSPTSDKDMMSIGLT